MLDCHSCPCQKVMEAKCLDVITLNENLNDTHLEVAVKLKLELQNFVLSLSSWIETQRGYVKALNGWLHRCLLYEPEEIAADGVSSLSSSGCGVPPAFVILNQWSEVMDRLLEKEVVEAVNTFFISINQVLEQQHNSTLRQRIIADKDMERKVKLLEKEEQKMQKMMQARVKKMTEWAREESAVLEPRDTSTTDGSNIREAASLQHGLKQIFMAMEKLAIHFRQAYGGLHQCTEKCKATQDNP